MWTERTWQKGKVDECAVNHQIYGGFIAQHK